MVMKVWIGKSRYHKARYIEVHNATEGDVGYGKLMQSNSR